MQMIDRIHSLAEGCFVDYSSRCLHTLVFLMSPMPSINTTVFVRVWGCMLVPVSSFDPSQTRKISATVVLVTDHSGWKSLLFSFSLMSYLCVCKGVGSNRGHGWNGKDVEWCYLGWDDRSGTDHSEMKCWDEECERLIWPSLRHRGGMTGVFRETEKNNRFIQVCHNIS